MGLRLPFISISMVEIVQVYSYPALLVSIKYDNIGLTHRLTNQSREASAHSSNQWRVCSLLLPVTLLTIIMQRSDTPPPFLPPIYRHPQRSSTPSSIAGSQCVTLLSVITTHSHSVVLIPFDWLRSALK